MDEQRVQTALSASGLVGEQVPAAPNYPYFIVAEADRHRFDLAYWIAVNVVGAKPGTAEVWMASRAIFDSDLPTEL